VEVNTVRIGIDACCWANRRGFGRFTRELLQALVASDRKNEYLFFVDQQTARDCELPGSVRKIVVQTEVSPTQAASASGRRSLGDLWSLSREVFRHRLNLFFFPAVYSYFPIVNRTKVVVTLHDAIAEHYPDLVFSNRKLRTFWNLKRELAIRQADLIVTVSEYSRQQLIKRLGLSEKRVRAISEAPHSTFRVLPETAAVMKSLGKYQLSSGMQFMLYVGGISPHKNLNALVSAFQRMLSDPLFENVKLVLVGDYNEDSFLSAYDSVRRQVAKSGLEDKVIFTGFVSDEDLAVLYNAATLLVLPSFEEGFGLPAIEAMACGTPVVCSNRGPMPELLADAARFFDPTDVQMMTDVLKSVFADEGMRKRMRESALKRAPQFSWGSVATDTLRIFEEVSMQA
jgi:glycosyltransferase involved in cell wall biosynthesis